MGLIQRGKVTGVLLLFRNLTELRTLKMEIERSRRLGITRKTLLKKLSLYGEA